MKKWFISAEIFVTEFIFAEKLSPFFRRNPDINISKLVTFIKSRFVYKYFAAFNVDFFKILTTGKCCIRKACKITGAAVFYNDFFQGLTIVKSTFANADSGKIDTFKS